MDKYDHRKFHAKKLAKERYSSLFFFFVIVFAQLAISLWALSVSYTHLTLPTIRLV